MQPATFPTDRPTSQPSRVPTTLPHPQPSSHPSIQPQSYPSMQPSVQPSSAPSLQPTADPSHQPTSSPSDQPTSMPSSLPSSFPTSQPSSQPSLQPSGCPSSQPSAAPSTQPSVQPTHCPTRKPSCQPSRQPRTHPTSQPSVQPNSHPSRQPSRQPFARPSSIPTAFPSTVPSLRPTGIPTTDPSGLPSCVPSAKPSAAPDSSPSTVPTSHPTRLPFSFPPLSLIQNHSLLQPAAVTPFPTPVPFSSNDDVASTGVESLSPVLSWQSSSPISPFLKPVPTGWTSPYPTVIPILNPSVTSEPQAASSIDSPTTAPSNRSPLIPPPLDTSAPIAPASPISPSSPRPVLAPGNPTAIPAAAPSATGKPATFPTPTPTPSLLAQPPTPALQTVVFSPDGTYIEVIFNSTTNQGGYLNSFSCPNLLSFYGSYVASCAWVAPTIIAVYSNGYALTVGQRVSVLGGLIQAPCALSAIDCRTWRFIAAKSVILQEPVTPLLPTAVVKAPTVISGCSSLALDLSNSFGSGGRPWYSVSVHVTGTAANVGSVEKFLSESCGVDPLLVIPNSLLQRGALYVFSFRVCSFLRACGNATVFTYVSSSDAPVPIVAIDGQTTKSTTRPTSLTVTATAYTTSCSGTKSSASLQYSWTLTSDLSLAQAASQSKDPSVFILPAFSLLAGIQ